MPHRKQAVSTACCFPDNFRHHFHTSIHPQANSQWDPLYCRHLLKVLLWSNTISHHHLYRGLRRSRYNHDKPVLSASAAIVISRHALHIYLSLARFVLYLIAIFITNLHLHVVSCAIVQCNRSHNRPE